MKLKINFLRLYLFCAASAALLFTSACKEDTKRTRTYLTQVPVYQKIADVRAQSLSLDGPSELKMPGKIYVYGNYLFVNEVNKGIHIIDNTNPAKPKFLNFINIPGNADLAVNGNILYADSYIDLLAFDISDPVETKLVKRLEDAFPTYFINCYFYNPSSGIIRTFKDTLITEEIKEDVPQPVGRPGVWLEEDRAAFSSTAQSYGQGGSMARFTLLNSRLYTVDQSQLRLFDVSNPQNPSYVSKINLGWGIETIFPHENKLFIGSTTGMHIYDASNPSALVKLSTYRHVTSCDPVVVSGKYAYVTLRSGNFCQQGVNLLEVLNVENPASPKLVSSFAMKNPHGLSISGNNLFICEGDFGLKSFNAADVLKVGERLLQHLPAIKATDVIAAPNSLIVTGDDGIYQFNYNNASNLKQLSKLKIKTSELLTNRVITR